MKTHQKLLLEFLGILKTENNVSTLVWNQVEITAKTNSPILRKHIELVYEKITTISYLSFLGRAKVLVSNLEPDFDTFEKNAERIGAIRLSGEKLYSVWLNKSAGLYCLVEAGEKWGSRYFHYLPGDEFLEIENWNTNPVSPDYGKIPVKFAVLPFLETSY